MRRWLVLTVLAAACGFQEVTADSCFVYLVASDSHTCARRTDGTLVCWGNNQFGQLSGLEGEVAGIYLPTSGGDVSTRTAFSCARKADGTLWCWGNNAHGQLGAGDTDAHAEAVQADPDGLGDQVHAAALGSAFGCARTNDNAIWCWGANESGQLGTGDTDPRLTPVQVDPDGLGRDVRYVYTGAAHGCARKTDGTLWCWGGNQYGQLGTGDTERRLTPVQVGVDTLGAGVDVVFAGAHHTCASTTDGTLWCWGANQYGQLGVGDLEPRSTPTPVDLTDLGAGVSLVSAGGRHTCAGKTDGSLWCWGSNQAGQLGGGPIDNSPVPVPVDTRGFASPVALVYAGGAHTCARAMDSSLWCWGSNEFGQLGVAAGPGHDVPMLVAPACP
jgi:alpha-tubulin suppressor-like RCC1 family protein